MSKTDPQPPAEKGKPSTSLRNAVSVGALAVALAGGSGYVGFELGTKNKPDLTAPDTSPQIVLEAPRSWKPRFSPNGGCTDAIVEQIGKASRSIFVQAYSFSSQRIATALIDAENNPTRKVDVQIVMDKREADGNGSAAGLLSRRGITVFLDAAHQPAGGLQHNKIIIIDESIVVTGSFNFTDNAERNNAENLIIVTDPALAAEYKRDWGKHRSHSAPYGTDAKPIGPVSPEEAAKYMGKNQPCIVDLIVARVGRYNGRVFLNRKSDYTAKDNFVIVIESSAKPPQFPDMESYYWHLAQVAYGKTVRATGTIMNYNGIPQIHIYDNHELILPN